MKDQIDLKYDVIYNQINDIYDIRGSILHEIICHAIEHGYVPEEVKERFANAVQPDAFELLDSLAATYKNVLFIEGAK